jgi:LCP family protein required for cell wall assembly
VSLALASTAGAVGYVYWRLGKVTVLDDVTVDAVEVPEDPRNYLIVGSDKRSESDGDFGETTGERADAIMLVRFDPETKQAYMVSFPRDLWVDLPDGGEDRINAAYSYGGRQQLIDTIKLNFGVDVHHYIEVNFVAFGQLVDAIGGVQMYFDAEMRDGLSGLDVDQTGCVVLNGFQALAYARARHLQYRAEGESWRTDPTGDFGRISRQQLFVRRVVAQALAQNIFNPVKLNSLMDIALGNIGLDPKLGRRGALLDLADDVQGFELDNLHTFALTAEGDRGPGGASILRLDEAAARPIFNVFRGLDADAFQTSDITVSVYNGSGVSGQAGDVRDALDVVGFMTLEPSTAESHYERTTIHHAPGWAAPADLLARHLTSGAVIEEDPTLGPAELVLITGIDFTTVLEQPTAPTTTTSVPADVTSTTGSIASVPTTAPAETTATTVVGYVPGDPPPGVACG